MWSENTVCVILIILNLVYFRLKIRLPLFMLHGTWREYLSGCFRAALHACAVASVGGANEPLQPRRFSQLARRVLAPRLQ